MGDVGAEPPAAGNSSAPESEVDPPESQRPKQQTVKRTRILLSCAACRASKLKCKSAYDQAHLPACISLA